MKRIFTTSLVALLLVAGLLSFPSLPARSQDADPPSMAPPLRAPDDFEPSPLRLATTSSLTLEDSGPKAVAIVGDVHSYTDTYKDDMERAVKALRSHGVTVETFYYGDRTFSWADVVSAATGAHFLLYMGHGVHWGGGTCTEPELVGGFYLGDGGFVHPDQIRSDLAGRMAGDAVVIISHACYAAGDTACDSSVDNWATEAEAERRVRMYAAPFADIGLEAYFANNYYYSAANFVNELLADEPPTVGEVFKSVAPYHPDTFRDLSYPDDPAYDLWLSGETGRWNDGFVGIPDHVFDLYPTPQLGPLGDVLTFTYYLSDTTFFPSAHVLMPENVGSDDSLIWEVTASGGWFTVDPTSGQTPAVDVTDGFAVTPIEAGTLAAASYTGVVTVSVTSPDGTVDGVQAVEVNLETRSGGLNRVYLPLVAH